MEPTLYERLLRLLAKVVLTLVDMFGIDANEAMKKMITNENIPEQLINVLMELNKTKDNQIKSTEIATSSPSRLTSPVPTKVTFLEASMFLPTLNP